MWYINEKEIDIGDIYENMTDEHEERKWKSVYNIVEELKLK